MMKVFVYACGMRQGALQKLTVARRIDVRCQPCFGMLREAITLPHITHAYIHVGVSWFIWPRGRYRAFFGQTVPWCRWWLLIDDVAWHPCGLCHASRAQGELEACPYIAKTHATSYYSSSKIYDHSHTNTDMTLVLLFLFSLSVVDVTAYSRRMIRQDIEGVMWL